MATAQITLAGKITGMSEGGQLTLGTVLITPATPVVGRIDPLDLALGNNTIAVPVGATVAWFTPPLTNTQALRLKGITTDTGFGIPKTISWPILLDGSGDDLVINAAGTVAGCTVQFM